MTRRARRATLPPMTAVERLTTGAEALVTSVRALGAVQGQASEAAAEIASKEDALSRAKSDAAVVMNNETEAKASVGRRIDESIAVLNELKDELTS